MIYISAQRFNNQFRPSQDLGWLLALIGEKVTVETDFYFEDITYATADNTIILFPDAADVDLTDSTGIIWSEDGIAFTDYQVGDTIGVDDAGVWTYYTVNEKLTNGMVRTTYAGANRTLPTGSYVFNATPMAGVKYAWNLVPSGSSFNSLIDGEYQQAEIATADPTNLLNQFMAFKGLLSYQNGTVQIAGNGTSGGGAGGDTQQRFTITHDFIVTPLFLMEQYEDIIIGKKPDYFEAENCLNYICQIQLGRDLKNPNGFQTLDVNVPKSNTGWFGENYNGSKTNYSLTSLVIKDGTTTIDALRYDKDITVEAIIGNSADSPFSNGNTQWIFGFTFLPDNEDLYQDNGRELVDNFLYDQAKGVIGGSDNGDNYGNSMQVIKTVVSTHISSSSTKLTATINVGADAEAIIKASDKGTYMMWIMVENHSLAAALSDKVNLLIQVSDFDLELTTTDLITAEHNFIRHPYGSTDTTFFEGDGFNMFPVDDVAVNIPFSIDFNGLEDDGIVINKIINRLVIQHATESDITLEETSVDVSNFQFVDGYIQEIDFELDRVFKIPDSIRKTITVERDPDNDTGTTIAWIMNYPFMNRWEYWDALAILNPPSGIFDKNEMLNGLNNFWNRLANVSGWTMAFETEFQITQNGEEFSQVFTTEIDSSDFDSGTEWGNEFIKTYDPTGVTEQTSGGNKYISGYQDTWVKASFEKISGLIPAAINVEIVIWIETYEAGGITGIRRISSVEPIDSQSWFKSVDTSNKVKITKTGSTFVGEVLIDYTKLPNNTSYNIYSRIYDQTGGCHEDSITDLNGVCITDLDGGSILDL